MHLRIILNLYISLQLAMQPATQEPTYSLYVFNKYITVKDYKMLYQFIYERKRIIIMTLVLDGEKVKQIMLKNGHVVRYGKYNYEDLTTKITRSAKTLTYHIEPVGVKLTFTLNAPVKFSTRNKNYKNVLVSCRLYHN